MVYSPHYDPKKDRFPIIPEQAVQLGASVDLGRIPANLGDDGTRYNSIQNPANIVGKPRDYFDAVRMQRELTTTIGNMQTQAEDGSAAPAAPATPQE